MYIFNVQQLENVVNADACFYVRYFRVHYETGEFTVARRETEQVGIAAFKRIVLVCQRTPLCADTEHFSPFQVIE